MIDKVSTSVVLELILVLSSEISAVKTGKLKLIWIHLSQVLQVGLRAWGQTLGVVVVGDQDVDDYSDVDLDFETDLDKDGLGNFAGVLVLEDRLNALVKDYLVLVGVLEPIVVGIVIAILKLCNLIS